MSSVDLDALLTSAKKVRDEVEESANTAQRVGEVLVGLTEAVTEADSANDDTNTAAAKANAAAEKANTAATNADTAASGANTAANTANTAADAALAAATKANTAASTANAAANSANAAATKGNAGAEAANTAATAANTAADKATTAATSANSAADAANAAAKSANDAAAAVDVAGNNAEAATGEAITAANAANTAAAAATEAATSANTAAESANSASESATSAADAANAAAEKAEKTASDNDKRLGWSANGATMRFDLFTTGRTEIDTATEYTDVPDSVAFNTDLSVFVGFYSELSNAKGGCTLFGNREMYMNSEGTMPLKDKLYICGDVVYGWSSEKGTLVEVTGGSGSGFYNVTKEIPLSSGYYTKESAVAALSSADLDDDVKLGMIMTFEESAGVWKDYRYVGSTIASFSDAASWDDYGGGKIKGISLNGADVAPDANGVVALTIDQIAVDESLDGESTNPVQNAAVTAKINEISDAAVGGVEVIEGDEKNTLNILNKQGGVIASTEFSGGGGGGGTSTASRILITAALDKSQVKEGGTATLTYTYNHVNADGDNDGIKADITVTVSRGTTQTYSETTKNVSAGTYTLDISDYLLVGTTDVYVKAVATTADGTKQTKQAYTSLSVITLTLTSSYNLATGIAAGGYKDGETIEIPYTITGSGTKDISMYLDGSATPVVQTVNKSGTVNGSFTILASSLTSGRHNVQIVAERNGLYSDSIFIDFLKGGESVPYIGIKYTDSEGRIIADGYTSPTLHIKQYEQMSFNYVAYDPATTPAALTIAIGESSSAISVPRTMQTYTNRFTSQGTQAITLSVGTTTYTMSVEVEASSIAINETTYGLVAKLDAAGRSNTESNPAQWTSGDITTTFTGFDWSSNGWTGEALKLTNGAKAVINYHPFATDIKSTGLTIEMTLKVSNVMDRDAHVVECIDGGKGLLITAQEASFKTGQSITYTNEEDEQVTRDVKLGTNFNSGTFIKIALCISTKDENRLMHLYVDGNRTGADIYDTSFNFAQENPQSITIDSADADVEVKSIRVYNRAISDDEELENSMVDADTTDEMVEMYEENDILGDTGGVDIDKIRAKGKGVLRIVRANKLEDVYATNNKKTDFQADIYFYSPFGSEYDFVLTNCNIRIQGTSSTKYPSKNIRIYLSKGGEGLSLAIGGVAQTSLKYSFRPGGIAMNLLCAKSDYSDSSMSLNTGGAKLFNDVLKELKLFTPPQQYQYEQGGNQLSAINVRTAIDGIPIDVFCAETVDGESEYYGQYNLNNEKSKSQDLFGQDGVDGFTPAMPMTFETLNNTEAMCLFKTTSDEEIPTIFDAGLETNYPDDVKWVGLSVDQQAAVTRLYSWIRECVPDGATSDDISTFKSEKFVSEIDQYFAKDFILTYYLWTDYFLAVDQRAKNMLLRTWDGKVWYITYYDGDTQLGKRNDCFLVYTYTTDRDTYDAEASKYAFEGRDSWLWNLVLANLQDDLKDCAQKLRAVLTNDRVLSMLIDEQSGNWCDRAFNKSGELKYIKPATTEMYGKIWPFIYALQGANRSHREFFIKSRFALLDAKWGTTNFTSDNVDLYLSRTASDAADVINITANEIYAFGYGTNNSQNIANSGIINGGDIATLSIAEAYTVNDPLRIYGASRMKVLDMSGAADHLKNGLDLGKCEVLRELNLASAGTGSTGWWLVLSACKALKKIDLKNQSQAKTGSNTSTELDLSNQTRLEYLDASGTKVQSVNLAQGAPIATLILPATLATLKLEYLSQLLTSGLTIEGFDNVETFIFSGCPGLDWQTLLAKCVNVKRVRVTGIDIEDDGTLLDKYLTAGGVDADGNYVDTCSLVGTYNLTRYVDDETFAAYVEHYPELNISQPEYTMIVHNDDVAESASYSNTDNKTGYDYDNSYEPSGHIAKILEQRHRYLVKHTGKQEVTVCQLHDDNSNYFADATDVTKCTAATLTGKMGDVMIKEPDYWYKGINDILNHLKYSCFSSFGKDRTPKSEQHVKIFADDERLTKKTGYAVKTNADYTTIAEAEAASSANSYISVDVTGYKQVRWPSLYSSQYGALLTDASGTIVKRMKPTSSAGIVDGMYCFTSIPDGATTLTFTIANSADFDYVLLTTSTKVEAIEPDWVFHPECLTGVYEAYLEDDNLYSISGVASTASVSQADFMVYARNRGDGYQIVDGEMSKDVANLFYAKYGETDSQGTCGPGTHTNGRTMGASDATGMQDTKATAKDGDAAPALSSDGSYYPNGNAYVLKNPTDEKRTAIGSPVCMGYENWYGNKAEWCEWWLNKTTTDYKWRTNMPDGTERAVRGATAGGAIRNIVHGRYMDVVCALAGATYSTYYFDYSGISGSTARVVYRSVNSAYAYGGVSYAGANSGSASVDSSIGSRLAFRGAIKEVTADAFIAISESA